MKRYASIVLVGLLLSCLSASQVVGQTNDELEKHAKAFAAAHRGSESDRAEFVEYLLNGKTESGREYKREISRLFFDRQELHAELRHLMKALAVNQDCPLSTRQFAIGRLLRLLGGSNDEQAKPVEQALLEVLDSPGHERSKEIENTIADERQHRAILKKYANTTFKFSRQPSKEDKSPHPASQSKVERQNSLKARINLAIECLENDRYTEFIESHFDQNCLADFMFKYKASADQAAFSTLARFANKTYRKNTVQELKNLIDNDIQWSLGGRVGVSGNPHDNVMWLYRDGRWNYSPIELFSGGGPEADESAKPIDFFAKSDLFPKVNFEQLKDATARQDSLKETQTKALELVDSKSFRELIQFVICPVELARNAAGQGKTANAIALSFSNLPESRRDRFLKSIKTELEFQLANKSEWLLDGRIAAYKNASGVGIRDCVFWQFYEGRWRMMLR